MSGARASDPINDDLGWMLGVVFRAYVRAADHAVGDLPGGPRGYQVLTSADREPARNQGAIAEELGIDRTVLTYLIDDLEQGGLVVRRPDPADRRSRLVTLTETGRAAARHRREALGAVESRLLRELSPEQAGTLRALLRRVACAAQAVDPLTDLCQAVEAAAERPPTGRRTAASDPDLTQHVTGASAGDSTTCAERRHPAADSAAYRPGMRITKYTHSCVRLEHDGVVLVIDPGTWSEPRALVGADAVLVSHEHTDHIDVLRLAGLGVPVFAPEGAALPDLAPLPVTRVRAGQRFTAAGLEVTAFGGRHATIHGGQPDCPNLGYLVADAVYHPGDSLAPPDRPVRTLLVPAQASWLKLTEAIDFAVEVAAPEVLPIHDAQLNARGLASVNGWFGETVPGYRYLAPGESR